MAIQFDNIDFEMFVNVVECSSLTAGAGRSAMSLSAASVRLKNLEQMLGVTLMRRSSKGLSLTPSGETYLAHARRILGELQALRSAMQDHGSGIHATIRISANGTSISEYLPAVSGEFLQGRNDVSLDVRERTSDEVVRALLDESSDIGIVSKAPSVDGLEYFAFTSTRLLVIAPHGHEMLGQQQVTLRYLLNHDLVSLLEGSAPLRFQRELANALHMPMKVRVRVGGYDALCRMVESGVGMGLIPEVTFRRIGGAYELAHRLLDEEWAERPYYLCARSFRLLPGFAKDFVLALSERFGVQQACRKLLAPSR